MDTDALIIDDENNVNENEEISKEVSAEKTNAVGRPAMFSVSKLQTMLKNNPEIPDALRDMAPYFSNEMRHRIVQIAAVGDFMLRMSDDFSVMSSDSSPAPIDGLYSTMKKYIPMNKRQSIDGIMGMIQNIKTKMQPKPAANSLENMINSLTRLNEMKKLVSGASTIKKLADGMSKKDGNDLEGVMSLMNNIMGEDKMQKINSMLGQIIGGNV